MAPLMDGYEARSIGAYCALFLLLSGDDLLNPGPTRNGKHPCITCQKPVKTNGLQCDKWTFLRCLLDAIRITKEEYSRLSRTDKNWYRYQFSCQLSALAESEITDDEHDHADRFRRDKKQASHRPDSCLLKYQQPETQSE